MFFDDDESSSMTTNVLRRRRMFFGHKTKIWHLGDGPLKRPIDQMLRTRFLHISHWDVSLPRLYSYPGYTATLVPAVQTLWPLENDLAATIRGRSDGFEVFPLHRPQTYTKTFSATSNHFCCQIFSLLRRLAPQNISKCEKPKILCDGHLIFADFVRFWRS